MSLILRVATILVGIAGFSFAADEFPLRAKFPTTKAISTADVKAAASATIVDVRAEMEYDVIHINGSINLPISKATFLADLEKAVKGNKAAAIVTYCNGHTCDKSYIAAEKAMKAGFTDITVYDEGIMAWAKAYPDKTTLLGKTPIAASKLISKDAFKTKLISVSDFTTKASDANSFVIDLRDPLQRKVIPPYLSKAVNFPMDKMVAQLTNAQFKTKIEGKTLLIADMVGKQVQWLQYYLEDAGITSYYFLENGIEGK